MINVLALCANTSSDVSNTLLISSRDQQRLISFTKSQGIIHYVDR
jgi:hypothetical protein